MRQEKHFHSEKGASAIEYALLIACLVLVLVTALSGFGTTISDSMTNVFKKVQASFEG
jgi:Flp pilus assembly pilin Flp